VLRDEETTHAVIRYIVANPVRANIVHAPEDYSYWGSDTYTKQQVLDFIQGAGEWRPPR
jgi:hypothetical protein